MAIATLPETTVGFARDLRRHGDGAALITSDGEISYRALAARVADLVDRLGPRRRLVLLAGANCVDAIVAYLAALAGGHPLLLVPGGNDRAVRELTAAYDPDVIAHRDGDEWRLDERRAITTHTLHPDLALLLSTSGSTGSPKLVRLSAENLQANAAAIAAYLDIRPTDRAATTLPMHYCYGLSVINSHLRRGAALILTDRSVADPDFWQLFTEQRGSSFAGVPYTFDLLDRVGFAEMDLPHLRYVTQAGGRLAPDRVREYAELGRERGWDLFVMYGQTEATARMAYLPPDLAAAQPDAIGGPIPGGSLRLDPLPEFAEPGTGELVYAGPNVMLGYAHRPADLGLGRTVTELRTGDVARLGDDGLYRLVGRRSQFAKILGLRVDPDRVEALLAEDRIDSACAALDDELAVAITDGEQTARVRRAVAAECGLPPRAVRVLVLPTLPRLPTGKPDRAAVRAAAAARPAGPPPPAGPDLCRLYAEVLDAPRVTPDSSFVSLGGDSLSYVEMSIRLEQALGHLPANWHSTPIRELRRPERAAGRGRRLETSVFLRAVAIVLIVGTHAQLFAIAGGAHLLLGMAGFNLARFQLTEAGRWSRVRSIGTSLRRIALPSIAWIGLVFLLTDDYTLAQVLLGNYLVGPEGRHNHYWFIEALVYTLVFVAAVLPAFDRLERRYPFGLALGFVLLGLITRYQLIPGVHLRAPAVIFWLFALGWAAAKATRHWQRGCLSAIAVATIPGFFGDPPREAVILAGLLLLIWVPSLPSIAPVNWLAGLLGGASLAIYLTHWQVFPLMDQYSALLALVVSLAVGVAVSALAPRALSKIRATVRHVSPSRRDGRPSRGYATK